MTQSNKNNNKEAEKKKQQETKQSASDRVGHYDIDGVSYGSESGSEEVIVSGGRTSQKPDQKSKDSNKQDGDELLNSKDTSETKEKRKLSENPQKMDREKNRDFEGEVAGKD